MNVALPLSLSSEKAQKRVFIHVLHGALWLLLFLGILKVPAGPTSGLDPSWRLVIGHAADRGLHWGTDIVFTYGPLGYLSAGINRGANFNDFVVWQVASSALFATIVWAFGRSFTGWRVVIYYLYFAGIVANYPEALHLTIIVILGLMGLAYDPGRSRTLILIAGAVLAVLGLVKFTNLMLAGVAMATVAAHHAYRRRWLDLLAASGSFVGAFLVLWLLCGQRLGDLPAYIGWGLNATSGYGDGMSVYEDVTTLFLGLGAALATLAYLIISLVGRADVPRACAVALIVAASAFINWKLGFTRADGHVLAHYVACLLLPVTFPILTLDDGPFRRMKHLVLGLVVMFSAGGILRTAPTVFTGMVSTWKLQVKSATAMLRNVSSLRAEADHEYAAIAKLHDMPGVRGIVRDSPIDFLGIEQAYALFNGFHYAPRPVFQTYLPYTAELMGLNEQFYRSPRGPAFVLQKFETIDGRLPPLDDSLAANYLYHHYRYVTEELGMLLWERNPPNPAVDQRRLIGEFAAQFGRPVDVLLEGTAPIWVEIDVKPSLLGSVRELLYKPPQITITADDGGKVPSTYRLIRRSAAAGFMAHPFYTNGANILDYVKGGPARALQSFTLNVPPADVKYFERKISVRFYALAPVTRSKGIIVGAAADKFRGFDRVPSVAESPHPISLLLEDHREVLFAHPPSRLEFDLTVPVRRVSGQFGLVAKSYEPPNATDGAEFSVEWIPDEGPPVILFSRLLKPVDVPQDRGIQTFDIALPPARGKVVLHTDVGPANNAAFDWTYWNAVKFTP